MTDLIAENLTLEVDDSTLIRNISAHLAPGRLTIILGPNGAGKTTLLRAMLGLIPVTSGKATLDGAPTNTLPPSERALKVAYLPQIRPLAWPNRVREIIALGRFAHGGNLSQLTGMDAGAVDSALKACALEALADRNADTLSGGELARVHCARAFAAQTALLVADEPVGALDPRHQHQVMSLIRRFVDEGGGAFCVLHDITLAARYADYLIWMKNGEIISEGSPSDTLSSEQLKSVYDIDARVTNNTNGSIDVAIDGTT